MMKQNDIKKVATLIILRFAKRSARHDISTVKESKNEIKI